MAGRVRSNPTPQHDYAAYEAIVPIYEDEGVAAKLNDEIVRNETDEPVVMDVGRERALVDAALEDTLSILPVDDRDRYTDMVMDEPSPTGIVHRIDLMKLAFQHMQGMPNGQSAILFNCSMRAVAEAKNHPKFKALLAMLSSAAVTMAKTYISASVIKATKTMAHLLNSDSEKIRYMAAKDLLDRAGLKVGADVNLMLANGAGGQVHEMDDAQLRLLIRAALEEE